jgi:hypothetical protein
MFKDNQNQLAGKRNWRQTISIAWIVENPVKNCFICPSYSGPMRIHPFLFFFFLSLSVPLFSKAQDAQPSVNPIVHGSKEKGEEKDPNQEKFDKKKEEQEQQMREAEEKGRRRVLKIQTKEVRKRMKRSKKKARKNNEHKREFFLKKIFSKK